MNYFKYVLSFALLSYLNLNGMDTLVVSVRKGDPDLRPQEKKYWQQADSLLKKSQRNEQDKQKLEKFINQGVALQILDELKKIQSLNPQLFSGNEVEANELFQTINATLNS